MSDFFLDFRPPAARSAALVEGFLRYFQDIHVFHYESSQFSLTLTRCDDNSVWAPAESADGQRLVALAGRIAFEKEELAGGADLPSSGGLICKIILDHYEKGKLSSLRRLNGNFTIIICDRAAEEVHIVTDRCGAAPAFVCLRPPQPVVLASHPDLLAASLNENDLDIVSIAEFLSTGKVTYPQTYYKAVRALAPRNFHTILFQQNDRVLSEAYFDLAHTLANNASESDLAEELSEAFRRAIARRTNSIFGTTGIALSGGLDSRAILACCPPGANVKCFSFFDEQNAEFRTASKLAKAAGVELLPFKRPFDHYADAAEMGVRIYGGMGSFVNNHFLGFRQTLKDFGFENLLTGFYCDYLFKGLAQDVRKHPVTRFERHGAFSFTWYRPVCWFQTESGVVARQRIEAVFPEPLRRLRSDRDRLTVEALRVFPLCYEPDNAEATVPQRVMPWFLPIADSDILHVYTRIPAESKLNARLYSKMVARVCGPEMTKIPDSNTGAPVDAGPLRGMLALYATTISARAQRLLRPKLGTQGSWPDWGYYVSHSPKIRELWMRDQRISKDLLESILGFDPFERPILTWTNGHLELFLRVLTVKIWFEGITNLNTKYTSLVTA